MAIYSKADFGRRVDSGEDHESIVLDIANQTVKNPDNKALLRSALQNPDKPMHPYDVEKFYTLFRDLKKRAIFVSDELGKSPVFDRKPTVSKQVKSIFAQRHEGQTHTASVRRPPPQSPVEPRPQSESDDELAEYTNELSEIDRDIQYWLSNQDRTNRDPVNSSGSKPKRQFAKSGDLVETDDVSAEQLLGYLKQAALNILSTEGIDKDRNAFTGGLNTELPLRPTQRDSLAAFGEFLDRDDLSDQEKLRGFFEIPTGVGKTAIFVTLLRDAHKAAQQDGKNLRSAIVVPTIQLLWQTLAAVEEYAPELAEQVGLCGDNHKDLSQSLTLMTYDSWMILAESGQLSSANTHILISDEAHRGTSARKEESYFQAFSGVTANLGFTATSRFDIYKSAENVHKNLIFSRSIPESIRLGELCDYAQTQFYVIRVSPPRLNGEFKDAAELSGDMRQRLRRQAWSQRAEAIFVNGTDMHTGDLISDNQAGFFTADTYHADDLEILLNSNVTLVQRAKEQGKKGVAVAIHSRLPKKEKDRRLKAYTNGEYMAVIGDEQFKEGFDYPPMKTIVDWPHSSVVDKAQILGRGARKWWNELKERYEGMTFIDTIVYVGSNDLEQDKKDRENAIAQATTARTILEDAVVYAEGVELAPKKSKKPKVEELTTDELELEGDTHIHGLLSAEPEVSVVENERGNVNPQDILEVFEGEDGMPSTPLLSTTPTGLEGNAEGTEVHTVEGEEEKVLTPAAKPIEGQDVEEYADLEDVYTLFSEIDVVIERAKIADEKLVPITKAMRKVLNGHVERTNIGSEIIISKIANPPPELTHGKVYSWRNEVKTVNEDEWNLVIAAYEALPDARKIIMTDTMRDTFRGHVNRTQMGAKTFCKQDGVPETFYPNTHYIWLTNGKSINEDDWKAVIAIYEGIETNREIKANPVTPITKPMRGELERELARTQFPYAQAARVEDKNRPTTLTRGKIKGWLSGKVQSCDVDEYNWVIGFYRDKPSTVLIDVKKRSKLRALAASTKINRLNASLELHPEKPEGLRLADIKAALNFSKTNKSLPKNHYDWLVTTLRGLKLKAEQNQAKEHTEKRKTLETTFNLSAKGSQERQNLDAEMERTMVKGSFVASHIKKNCDFPEGLTEHVVKNVLDGHTDILRETHYEFLVGVFSDLPSKVRLSDSDIESLNKAKADTGVSFAKAIQRGSISDLKVGTVNNWSSAKSTIAVKSKWDALIQVYGDIKKQSPSYHNGQERKPANP